MIFFKSLLLNINSFFDPNSSKRQTWMVKIKTIIEHYCTVKCVFHKHWSMIIKKGLNKCVNIRAQVER